MVAFRDYTATVYTFSTQTVKGSLIQAKTVKYTGIPIALWGSTKAYNDTTLAGQTNSNGWEANLSSAYPIAIGDVFVVDGAKYKADKVVEHRNFRGVLDNYQIFLSKTDNG